MQDTGMVFFKQIANDTLLNTLPDVTSWPLIPEFCSYLIQSFTYTIMKNELCSTINSVNLMFFHKIFGYFVSKLMGSYLSLPLHPIIIFSSFNRFKFFSSLFVIGNLCEIMCYKCWPEMFCFAVFFIYAYFCRIFSSQIKLICKLLMRLRTNAITFTECL